MKVLLVGGPFDGKQHDCEPESTAFIEATYLPTPASAAYVAPENPDATLTTYLRVRYDRVRWSVVDDQGAPSYRYAYAYMRSPAALFDRLIECYAPTKDERIKKLEHDVNVLRVALSTQKPTDLGA